MKYGEVELSFKIHWNNTNMRHLPFLGLMAAPFTPLNEKGDLNLDMVPLQANHLLKNGVKAWEGSNKEIFKTENEAIVNFVYSSNLFRKVREAYLNEIK